VFCAESGAVVEHSPSSKGESGAVSRFRKGLQPSSVRQFRDHRREVPLKLLWEAAQRASLARKINPPRIVARQKEFATVINRGDVKHIHAQFAALLNEILHSSIHNVPWISKQSIEALEEASASVGD